MARKRPTTTANQINWKKAYLITLPIAGLALLATALFPKPLVTIAPYDGTIIQGAQVRAEKPAAAAPAETPARAPITPPAVTGPLPYELAPIANGEPDHETPLRNRLERRKEKRRSQSDRILRLPRRK